MLYFLSLKFMSLECLTLFNVKKMFLSNVKNYMSPFAHTFDICVFRCLPLHPVQTEKLAVSRQTEGSVIIYFGIFSQLLNIITHRQFLTLPLFARRLVLSSQKKNSSSRKKEIRKINLTNCSFGFVFFRLVSGRASILRNG